MDNTLIVDASVGSLSYSLGRLWDAIRRYSPDRPVAMPILASGLARLGESRDQLLEHLIASWRRESVVRPICPELRIVVHPSDVASVELWLAAQAAPGSLE
jgi:hypothetical protein